MNGVPSHHDRDMYHDTRGGTDMKRWLCTEPGCTAVMGDDQLAAVRDLQWTEQQGIRHPGWHEIRVGGDPT